MNIGKIATVGLIGFKLGLVVLDIAAKKHACDRAEFKAIDTRPDDMAMTMKECSDRCDIFKEMQDRENKEIVAQTRAWKVSKEFDKRKNTILAEVDDGLLDFKVSIDYSGTMDALQDTYDAGVEAFKNSIEYDSNKEKLEELIEEAKEHYEQQKTAFEAAGDDISETAMKLRHAAEESMEAKVKDAKEKIAALDKQVETEVEKLKKTKLEKTKALEEKVSKEKIRLQKKQEKDLEKLNQELDSAKNDIRKRVEKMRTAVEDEAVARHEDDILLIENIRKRDSAAAQDILANTQKHEMLAEYLTDKNVPKWLVGVIGVLPLFPAEYLIYRYLQFVLKTVRAMV